MESSLHKKSLNRLLPNPAKNINPLNPINPKSVSQLAFVDKKNSGKGYATVI